MCNRLIVIFAIFSVAMMGCSRKPERLPNGKAYIKAGGHIYNVYWVRERDGMLVYAFVKDHALTLIETSNRDTKPLTNGVHWLRHSRDGVWVFGSKVEMPKSSKLFAIRKDGSVHPVPCTQDHLDAIGPGGSIRDPDFVQDSLLPALGLSGTDPGYEFQ